MITALVIGAMLCLIRVSAFVAFLPVPSGRTIPATVRIGLAVAITFCLAEQHAMRFMPAPGLSEPDINWLQLGWLAAQELMYGLSLAWMLSMCLVPIRIAGAYIAQEMGLTMGGLASPQDQQPSNVVTSALDALAGMVFFSLNLHHIALGALGHSFTRGSVASGRLSVLPEFRLVLDQISRIQEGGLVIAAPVGIMLFLFFVTLMVTIRSAPQFNFFAIGMPMRVAVGTVALMLFLPQLHSGLAVWMKQVARYGVF